MADGNGSSAPSGRRYRLGFFGAFHPMTDRAGAASTGMALLLARSPRVERLVVFGPREAVRPPGIADASLEVVPSWSPNNPRSLIACLRELTARAPGLDGYIFSIYPTFFGRSATTNALGMMVPVLLRRLTGKPVVVFMHNFVESQDHRTLGYDLSPVTLMAARWLERRVGRSTRLAAGLESLSRVARSQIGVHVDTVPMRFMESVPGLLEEAPSLDRPARTPGGRASRVLLFGSWGPQKDLEGALRALRPLADANGGVRVTVAGGAHVNFPEYGRLVERLAGELPRASFEFLGHVDESQVPTLFRSHDVLVMPYRATGGYSGVMNVGASYGIGVVAYDQPQLRECARQLGLAAEFVREGDAEALRNAVVRLAHTPPPVVAPTAGHLAEARAAIEALLDLLTPGAPLGAPSRTSAPSVLPRAGS